ncbi:hypothetical protein GCM10007425_17990 [Lysinibacillus alkalisoli]|uniref:Uncharacterized protein n=1 Tax=Lysinibacillus alkalisoli TaxID=1911548 RepID=A0A917LHI5_9BACI|nr:DNA-binding protein [Lysinibacillus alkalisoli]GGG23937.1 hypothetical protein GCM10007425_17990 [Lysinibacillus alkalisoli]
MQYSSDSENLISITIKREFGHLHSQQSKEWMTLKEGSSYAGISFNTFIKFRLMGLKVCEIDGVKRISKTEIDNFLNTHSY